MNKSKKIFLDFPTCVKLGVGSACGSASKWNSDPPIYNTGLLNAACTNFCKGAEDNDDK
jgi:hypothetical protein